MSRTHFFSGEKDDNKKEEKNQMLHLPMFFENYFLYNFPVNGRLSFKFLAEIASSSQMSMPLSSLINEIPEF